MAAQQIQSWLTWPCILSQLLHLAESADSWYLKSSDVYATDACSQAFNCPRGFAHTCKYCDEICTATLCSSRLVTVRYSHSIVLSSPVHRVYTDTHIHSRTDFQARPSTPQADTTSNANRHTQTNPHTYIYIYTCMHMYIYIYICMYTHTYTYTHIFMQNKHIDWPNAWLNETGSPTDNFIDSEGASQ